LQHRTPVEDIEVDRLDLVEDAQAAGDDGADFQAHASGQVPAQRGAGVHQGARAVDLEAQQGLEGAARVAVEDVPVVDTEAEHVVLRQVDPSRRALGGVDADILPVVDELQRRTDRIRTGEVLRARMAEQVQQQASHGIGRAAAVVHQFGKVLIAVLGDVLHEGIEQVAEQLQRQAISGDHRAQSLEHRMPGRFVALYGVELGLVAGEQGGALGRQAIPLVGKIVGAAGEGVDRRHRLAQGGRQENRGNGEVFVMFDRHDATGVYTELPRSPCFHGGGAERNGESR
jgi:hypothetical protein